MISFKLKETRYPALRALFLAFYAAFVTFGLVGLIKRTIAVDASHRDVYIVASLCGFLAITVLWMIAYNAFKDVRVAAKARRTE